MAVIAGFPRVPPWFRKLFPYSKWGAEVNAWITPIFFRYPRSLRHSQALHATRWKILLRIWLGHVLLLFW